MKLLLILTIIFLFLSCTDDKPCEKNLCYNHGKCQTNGRCLCDVGYNPPYCNECAEGYFLDSNNICSETSSEYMVSFKSSEFDMGCSDESCNLPIEKSHKVKLSEFSIDKYEVSTKDYKKCVDAKVCKEPISNVVNNYCNYGDSSRDEHPINCIKWSDANDYCLWLHKRLPTEAEWEFAAKGKDNRIYPWGGEKPNCKYLMMFNGKAGCGIDRTAKGGLKKDGQTPDGIYDMSGNVWEWTSDWYDKDYYSKSPIEDPKGADKGIFKVARGGGFLFNDIKYYRTTYRGYAHPEKSSPAIGFRCVR